MEFRFQMERSGRRAVVPGNYRPLQQIECIDWTWCYSFTTVGKVFEKTSGMALSYPGRVQNAKVCSCNRTLWFFRGGANSAGRTIIGTNEFRVSPQRERDDEAIR